MIKCRHKWKRISIRIKSGRIQAEMSECSKCKTVRTTHSDEYLILRDSKGKPVAVFDTSGIKERT